MIHIVKKRSYEQPPWRMRGMKALFCPDGIKLNRYSLPMRYMNARWMLTRFADVFVRREKKSKYLFGAHVFRAKNDGSTGVTRPPAAVIAHALNTRQSKEHA